MLKAMIVDDELLMRLGIRSMIDWEEHGFGVAYEAANGKEALEMAAREQPDLVITDIKMPVMDGLQFIREASKLLPSCKFVILSNFDEFPYVKEALKLGAADYLIKSEISPDIVIELLADVRRSRSEEGGNRAAKLPTDFSHSLTYLKENLFKDLISGLIDEREAIVKAGQLQMAVRSDDLMIVRLRIDDFEEVRLKYVEQDEKLLRFSIINILNEVIPGKLMKELVIENSSHYLLIVNPEGDSPEAVRLWMTKLCRNIQRAVKDFMNLSFSIGVSSVVSGYRQLKIAYREADDALRRSFFAGAGHILFFEDPPCGDGELPINPSSINDSEEELRQVLNGGIAANLAKYFEQHRVFLFSCRVNERLIRESYLRLTEIISNYFSFGNAAVRLPFDKLPYQAVFSAKTWDDLHRIVIQYGAYCLEGNSQLAEQRSYAEIAADLIHRFYAEEISLQSVASQINVNPSYLSRVFKQEMGANFISYLTQIRIDKAKSYLASGRYKVYEVADKVGYHNYTYFSKIFKKVAGVSPEDFRS